MSAVTDELMKQLKSLLDLNSNKDNPQIVYQDWVNLMACAIRSQVTGDEKIESKYLEIAGRYSSEEMIRFSHAFAVLQMLMNAEISDWLGFEYMKSGAGSSRTGQFFTPFHLAYACAKLAGNPAENTEYLEEPACGGGAMILARAKALQDKGLDFTRIMKVTACDIDSHCVRMAYVQLSLLGIRARVIHGNTLSGESHDVWYTPAWIWGGEPM